MSAEQTDSETDTEHAIVDWATMTGLGRCRRDTTDLPCDEEDLSEQATVVYNADGTQTTTLTGHRIASQIFPDGRATIEVLDKRGQRVEVLQVKQVWSIRKTRSKRR